MLDDQFIPCNFGQEDLLGVQSEMLFTTERLALDFLVAQDAISFGNTTIVPGGPERFSVRSFLADNYLYILCADEKSKEANLIRFFAPHGLTINEVRLITKWHHKTQLDS